jgi:hypothetical protein
VHDRPRGNKPIADRSSGSVIAVVKTAVMGCDRTRFNTLADGVGRGDSNSTFVAKTFI